MTRELMFKGTIKWIISFLIIFLPNIHSCKKTIIKDVSFPNEINLISDSIIVPPVIYAAHPGLVITGENLIIIEPSA